MHNKSVILAFFHFFFSFLAHCMMKGGGSENESLVMLSYVVTLLKVLMQVGVILSTIANMSKGC